MAFSRSLVVLCLASLLLTSCGETRQDLGFGRNPPDEFAVIEHPPLSLPPEYTLKPPRPGAPRPQATDPQRQASETLFSGNSASMENNGMSDSEKSLLAASGASKAAPDIRQLVEREASQKVVASPHLIQRLMNWNSPEKPATTVDAEGEAARIKKALESKQPVTTGATPVIEKESSGWLGL